MKADYMTRLERWARWMLPRQEAEDVLADYRDIVGSPPRPEEELLRDLGKPRSVIRPLAQPRQYRTWLAAFAVMAACLLIPAYSPLPGGLYFVWFNMFVSDIPGFTFCRFFLIVGAAVSLVWFRPRKGEAKAPLPRAVPIALAVLLAFMALVWWAFWQLTLYPGGALVNPIFHLPFGFWWPLSDVYVGGNLLMLLLECAAVPLMILGAAALVKARTRDRRWRAVYFLSLSAMMLAFAVLALLTSMDVSSAPDTWWLYTRQACIEITAIALLGTGVSLC